ncbi:molybdopterin-dependent oxidoreductase [Arsenicibacter rosenii]|uniref:Molybdopterin-binding protein n=1 Tax=Arsenicibacter rosenii TaxID=1750698 RepID=A0A1S2VLU5_9BACT|nr:molybdopterin-dependent oxidoreductase [Arsenicibacter rosenii]OIN59741.1 molybdopterin-binding protein [Arsenicibacter rosenii]
MKPFLLCTLCLLCLATRLNAQTLTISGEVARPVTLSAEDIKALPHQEVTGKDRDGKELHFSGVPVIELLKKAGVTTGGELRGENLAKYAVVKAIDGYEVVFALPEFDPAFASQVIILANRVDGAPLPAGTGPFRIVVPNEKRPARWVREVRSIDIRFAK